MTASAAPSSASGDATPGQALTHVHPLRLGLLAVIGLAMLYTVFTLYLAGQAMLAVLVLAVLVGFSVIYTMPRLYAQRFIFPGVAAVLLFIAFPVGYTVYLGFTNYASSNLLSFERVQEVHLNKRVVDEATKRPFKIAQDGAAYRLFLPDDAGGPGGFVTGPLALDGAVVNAPLTRVEEAPAPLLPIKAMIKLRTGLAGISVTLPDGTGLRKAGLREFAAVTPLYTADPDGTLIASVDQSVLTPNHDDGFYYSADGEKVTPGWRVGVGFANFERVFTSEGIRAPMLRIFVWTVAFALMSVGFTFAIGLALAMVLQWPHLKGKTAYRIALILPYAVPSFISILVFRGLFNQNFGEINLILNALFGISPEWFTNGTLARSMLVVVNCWLGYPYMMLLAMGFLQAVPEDHKLAARLEGASGWLVFRKITLPQILPPFLPLLIASFAFNFNNIVLVLLLTRGLPDIPGTVIPAGETDILGSFTFRMAFIGNGQQFGLAGAITFLIFIVVAALAYANFVAMRRAANKGEAQ